MTTEYKKRELIILGMGETRKLCPFDDKNIELWSCNNGYTQIAEMHGYLSKIFMSHIQHRKIVGKEDGTYIKGKAYSVKQMNMLVDHGAEIFNLHKIKGLKSKMYPLKRIDKKLRGNGFYSDTICYMLAYAIDRATKIRKGKLILRKDAYTKIRIYGVDMLTKDEYELEKGGIEYWIGFARGKGIEVEISPQSALCKTCTGKPYGIKFFNFKDIDPWKMLRTPGKDEVWKGQAMPTKKQWAEIKKNLII